MILSYNFVFSTTFRSYASVMYVHMYVYVYVNAPGGAANIVNNKMKSIKLIEDHSGRSFFNLFLSSQKYFFKNK